MPFKDPEYMREYMREYMCKYRKAHPQKVQQWDQRRHGARWAYRIFHNYGLTETEYNEMLEDQDYACKICSRPIQLERHGKLVVDHIKGTKAVRGLLCHGCNRGLGFFKENTLALSNAIEYLRCQPLI